MVEWWSDNPPLQSRFLQHSGDYPQLAAAVREAVAAAYASPCISMQQLPLSYDRDDACWVAVRFLLCSQAVQSQSHGAFVQPDAERGCFNPC
jgi:hypothetical protein